MNITSSKALFAILERPLPEKVVQPFPRKPQTSVLVRGYTLGEAKEWKRGRPYLGYAKDQKTLMGKKEKWPQAVLERTCSLCMESGVVPLFTGDKGDRLFRSLALNAPGVIRYLSEVADRCSWFYQAAIGLSPQGEFPDSSDLFYDLLSSYTVGGGGWYANVLPQEPTAALYLNPYTADVWADFQLAANSPKWGFELEYGLGELFLACLATGPGGEPLVAREELPLLEERLPQGTANTLFSLITSISENQVIPDDFFGEPREGALPTA